MRQNYNDCYEEDNDKKDGEDTTCDADYKDFVYGHDDFAYDESSFDETAAAAALPLMRMIIIIMHMK